MEVLDLFFKKYSYIFPKGYPDMNDKNDVLLLKKLLKENMDIDLEEEQTKIDFPPEKDFKKELINLVNNVPADELMDDPIYKSLFKRLKNHRTKFLDDFKAELDKRNIGPLYKAIYNIAEDFGEADDLYNYLVSKDQIKSLPSSGMLDNLYINAIEKYNISKALLDILATKGEISIKGVSMGKGELILILMVENAKGLEGKGDVQIGDEKYELKADKARFPNNDGEGKGREGNISQIYDILKNLSGIESNESLDKYILEILTQNPSLISEINKIINKIYPRSEKISLNNSNTKNSSDIRKILLQKYLQSYILNPERINTKYMFITKDNKYVILEGDSEKLIEEIIKYKFSNITKSSAFPQITL